MLTDLIRNYVMRHQEQLCFQKATVLEKDQHDVSPDEIKRYLDTVGDQVKSIPLPFLWTVNETRAGCPKKIALPEVFVASNMKFSSVTVTEARDDM
jgi:hypothetical protein